MRRGVAITIAFLLVAFFSGCGVIRGGGGPAATGTGQIRAPHTPFSTKPGDYNESITVDGRTRTYLIHIPSGFDEAKRYPLVLGFHGGRGTGEKFARQTNFSLTADQEGFLMVYPDGIQHGWNDGRGTTDAEKLGVDDIKFLRALINDIESKLPIDTKRIYATGASNGGIFVQRLACDMADIFAAIGSDIGPIATHYISQCRPVEPISIVAIQGDADPLIPIQGGEEGGKSHLGHGGLVESADHTLQFWVSKNNCRSSPNTTQLPAKVNDGTSVTQVTYTNCRHNTEVRYYIVHGMGHTWPPHQAQAPRISGPTSTNIDATQVFWEFFKNHPKPQQ